MHALPDITSHKQADTPLTLQWVGMEKIAVPVLIKTADRTLQTINAKADVYVSLDKVNAKGIHMSRLHKQLNRLATMECQADNIHQLLSDIIDSQRGISQAAKLSLSFELLIKKPALLTDESGYQTYPVNITVEKGPTHNKAEISLEIPYSSTCPCSTALAQQLYAEAIQQQFPDDHISQSELLAWVESSAGAVATPHSQRSYAYIRISLAENRWPDLAQLILELEQCIGTPVQTAVKRQDEQAFAKLNANNLMFCEDAARRIKQALKLMSFVDDYWFKVEHQESLHAHNAVVIDSSART